MTKLIDVKELAALLNIPPGAVYKLLYEKPLDGAYRVGKRWRFDPERVLKSLEAS